MDKYWYALRVVRISTLSGCKSLHTCNKSQGLLRLPEINAISQYFSTFKQNLMLTRVPARPNIISKDIRIFWLLQ